MLVALALMGPPFATPVFVLVRTVARARARRSGGVGVMPDLSVRVARERGWAVATGLSALTGFGFLVVAVSSPGGPVKAASAPLAGYVVSVIGLVCCMTIWFVKSEVHPK